MSQVVYITKYFSTEIVLTTQKDFSKFEGNTTKKQFKIYQN